MNRLDIVVGTVTGTALSISRYLKKQLDGKLEVYVHEYPCFDDILSNNPSFLLFCVSNTGVGELPPSMRKMFVQLTEQKRDLSGIEYLLINLGDSSFKTFAQSGVTLNNALQQCNATNLDDTLVIDAMHDRYPRQTALDWLNVMLKMHG